MPPRAMNSRILHYFFDLYTPLPNESGTIILHYDENIPKISPLPPRFPNFDGWWMVKTAPE